MTILFFQTADAFKYKAMLDISALTVVEYCRRHDFGYESFVGVKRGFHPWQASFNRFFMFRELIDRGYRGWAVYLDADAYVYDLDFDLAAYLADKADRAGVLTPVGNPKHWDVNNGVMFLNLADERAHRIVDGVLDRYAAVDDDALRALALWPGDINDQMFLHQTLDQDEALRDSIHYGDPKVLNALYATFIRQILRNYYPDIVDRTNALRLAVDQVMGGAASDDFVDRVYPILMSALYRTLLWRDPDALGLDNFRARFHEHGIETAFRQTFEEFLVSKEYADIRSR